MLEGLGLSKGNWFVDTCAVIEVSIFNRSGNISAAALRLSRKQQQQQKRPV